MEQKKNIDLTTFKLDDFFSTQEDRDEDKKEKVELIDLSLIDDFPERPFKVQENEDLSKLKESIKDSKKSCYDSSKNHKICSNCCC